MACCCSTEYICPAPSWGQARQPCPAVSNESLQCKDEHWADQLGQLCLHVVAGSQALAGARRTIVPRYVAETFPLRISCDQQETDDIAFNKDNAKGPIFQPAKNDYAETFKAGAKDSKDRAQYDTGKPHTVTLRQILPGQCHSVHHPCLPLCTESLYLGCTV